LTQGNYRQYTEPTSGVLRSGFLYNNNNFHNNNKESLIKIFREILGYFVVVVVLTMVSMWQASATTRHDPEIDWKTIHSDNFIIHFPSPLAQRANQVAVIAEKIHDQLALFFDWTPAQKTEIVLTENALSPSGFASERPRNRIMLHLKAEYAGRQGYGDFARLLAHEYTHILHLDKVAGVPGAMRSVLGRNRFLFPNSMQPLWGIEGLASYTTDYVVQPIAAGESEYFEALMRIEVANGIKSLAQINIPVDEWPFVSTPYLYGEEWLRYLVETYGKDSLRNLVENYSNNFLPYFINSNSRSVYEKDLNALYDEFKRHVDSKYAKQLAAIKANAFPQDQLVAGQLSNCGGLVEINKVQYFTCHDWLSSATLISRDVDSGQVRTLDALPDSVLVDGHDDKLLVLRQDWKRNTINTIDVYKYEIQSGQLTPITSDGYYLFAKWIADSRQIVTLRYIHDKYRLDLLNENGQLIKNLWTSSADEKVSVYDVSADEKRILASVWRDRQYWQLEEFSLDSLRWRRLYTSSVTISAARYSNKPDDILVTALFNKVPNIYRLNLTDRSVHQLTNVIGMTGGAKQVESGIYYTQFQHDGFKIFQLSDRKGKKIDTSETIESLPSIASNEFVHTPVDDKSYDIRDYSPLPGLTPNVIVPRINTSNKLKTLGVKTFANDALFWHRYQFQVDHISTVAQNAVQLDYRYDRLYPTVDYHFVSDVSLFYDASDRLQSIERSNRHHLDLVFPVLKSEARWAFYGGVKKEDFHWYAEDNEVNLSNPASENIYGIAVLFDSSKSFARSIGLSEGRSMRFVAEKSLPDSDFIGSRYQFEWREYFNLGRAHILSTKLLGGKTYDRLRNYYLGGEYDSADMSFAPSSMLDVLPASPFSRRGFPFRGFASGIAPLTGNSMALLSLDWTFPLLRINKSMMSPPIGVRHIAGRVFIDRGDAWNEHANWLTGYGMELRFAMQLFYRQPATWRFGAAKGTADFSETRFYHFIQIEFL